MSQLTATHKHTPVAPTSNGMAGWLTRLPRADGRTMLAVALAAVALAALGVIHPRGLSVATVTPWANQVVSLAFAAVAQFCVVLTGGLDLSVGAIVSLTNVVGSHVLSGSPAQVALGCLIVLATGVLCGIANAVLVVHGRVEPIIATLSSGAIYTGISLLLRPSPGGKVDEVLSDLLTYEWFSVVPTSAVLLALLVGAILGPLSYTLLGRSMRAIGSNSAASHMTGFKSANAIFAAYGLSGLFAACAGLFLTAQTLAGDAGLGSGYTLNSIAAVVLGGVSLAGGRGSVIGVIAGAAILKTIGAITIFTGMPALAQPLFEGLVLLVAVATAGIEVIRNPNRLEQMR